MLPNYTCLCSFAATQRPCILVPGANHAQAAAAAPAAAAAAQLRGDVEPDAADGTAVAALASAISRFVSYHASCASQVGASTA